MSIDPKIAAPTWDVEWCKDEKNGDRHTPATGVTQATKTLPKTPVNGYLRMYWTLNQSEDSLKAFLPFCEKYGCYETDGDFLEHFFELIFPKPQLHCLLQKLLQLLKL